MVRKTVVLSQENIDFVNIEARKVSDPRAINPNFSKGLNKILDEVRKNVSN